jgi:hypothetical protein
LKASVVDYYFDWFRPGEYTSFPVHKCIYIYSDRNALT